MTNHTTQDHPLNQFQRTTAENYAGGDFAWILDHPDWRNKCEDCGDTFFTFLMLEFSDLEYPTDKADALKRLQRVADDVEELYDNIDALQQPANRIFATLVPQVWINDRAVTAAVLAMTRAEALELRDDTEQPMPCSISTPRPPGYATGRAPSTSQSKPPSPATSGP